MSSFVEAFSHLKDSKFYDDASKPLPPTEEERKQPAEEDKKRLLTKGDVSPSTSTGVTATGSGSGISKPNCILVNPRQRGNPILKFVRNVPLEYNDIVPDYIMGQTTCALFLSLRYHMLNPDYIHERLKLLGQQFKLRILLVQVDVKDPHHTIKELTKMAISADCTLLLAWSPEEAGRYLEIYKVFENKPPDLIMERQDGDPVAKITDAITTVKSVNRSNSATLLNTFQCLKNVVDASKEDLSFCPGMGQLRGHLVESHRKVTERICFLDQS